MFVFVFFVFFFFKQKTAYEMRISDWSSDVRSSDLAGDRVLVLGTGGVSIFALHIAKAMGAHVIATSSSAAKLERLAALGADQVINYRSIPEVQDPDGKGVDHVVEVGGQIGRGSGRERVCQYG